MKNSVKKDKQLRQLFYKNMCSLQFFKYIAENQKVPEKIRLFYKKLLCKNVLVKIRNRCVISGRGRGVYQFCKLSRNVLQEKALAGYVNGWSKGSW